MARKSDSQNLDRAISHWYVKGKDLPEATILIYVDDFRLYASDEFYAGKFKNQKGKKKTHTPTATQGIEDDAAAGRVEVSNEGLVRVTRPSARP